jgi:hypothetical protein
VSCQGYFYETDGTIFHGKRSSPELIVHVIACLAEGLGIRGTARVFEIDANTVLHWLMEAAEQLQAFSAYFLDTVAKIMGPYIPGVPYVAFPWFEFDPRPAIL